MNKPELWRREIGLSQREVADRIKGTDAVVVSAEKGRPIRREFIDAYLKAGAGFLAEKDFTEAATRGVSDGRKKKGDDAQRRRGGAIRK